MNQQPIESSWRALECNPEVIANYCKNLGGPQNFDYYDILSTDDWALELIPQPVYALLFVYPIKPISEGLSKEMQKTNKMECEQNHTKKAALEKIWFTKQTVANACGTVALLHVFGNLGEKCCLEKGGYLERFYQKLINLSPNARAAALESDESMFVAHTSAEAEGQSLHREEVREHFIAFVEFDGYVIELDGRKQQPIIHEMNRGFLHSAIDIIQRNYISPDPTEIRFSMIAVCGRV